MRTLSRLLIVVLILTFLLEVTVHSQSVPTLGYEDQLQQYNKGRREPAFVRALARLARKEGDKANAAKISANYIATIKDAFAKDNIEFMREFTESSKERGFDLFYRNAVKIDQIMGKKGYSRDFVEYIIAGEGIDPLLFPGGKLRAKDDSWNPDWDKITATITGKYNATYADRTISDAKVRWYESRKEWPPEYLKCLVVVVERYLERQPDLTDFMPTVFNVNNPAWRVFQHSTDNAELNIAISWMVRVLRRNEKNDLDRAFYMDTYANLLYKVGRKDEAVKWEEAALNIATATKQTSEGKIKQYESVADKMKRGEATWPTK
jgi:hypothetical protein